MSRIRVYLFVLSLVLGVAVQFGNCEKNTTDCAEEKSANGTDKTKLSKWEKIGRYIINFQDKQHFPFYLKPKNDTSLRDKRSSDRHLGSFSDVLDKLEKIHFIVPGTLWCGNGDIAKNESDLGLFKETDACCREHDHCTVNILAGDTKGNLQNDGIFTRSACTCDLKFYECLKKVDGIVSNKIGFTYFDILGPQCFKCKCPTSECNLKDGMECNDQCNKYEWINNPKY